MRFAPAIGWIEPVQLVQPLVVTLSSHPPEFRQNCTLVTCTLSDALPMTVTASDELVTRSPAGGKVIVTVIGTGTTSPVERILAP